MVAIRSNIQLSSTRVNLHKIMLKELNVAGPFQFNVEFSQALDLIASGQQDSDQLIASRFSLADTGLALEHMRAGKAAGKILIKPWRNAPTRGHTRPQCVRRVDTFLTLQVDWTMLPRSLTAMCIGGTHVKIPMRSYRMPSEPTVKGRAARRRHICQKITWPMRRDMASRP